MHDMTAAHLRSAFGGESMAYMRYLVWGEKAESDGFANVGRLFVAISAAERVHATNHFKCLRDEGGAFLVASGGGFGFGATSDNLAGGIEGEDFEVREMYPAYLEVARSQGEKDAERSFQYALEAEKIHRDMYQAAKTAVDGGEDLALGPVHICKVCGHTVEGDEPPGACPICGAKREAFMTFG